VIARTPRIRAGITALASKVGDLGPANRSLREVCHRTVGGSGFDTVRTTKKG